MIPEYDNEKPIRLEWDKFNPENAELVTNENGIPIRKSHSNYVGTRIQIADDKYGYTHFKMLTPPKCYVARSKINEHGVFAAKDFSAGDLIEESKMIILDTTENTSKDWVLNRYAMAMPCDCNICKTNGKTLFIANGNIMMYNHSDTPNAFYYIEKPFRRIKVIALTDIKKDEEVTWYYGEDVETKFKDIVKYYPRPDIPEGMPAYAPEFHNIKPCTSCQENNQVQFRSMIVPERIVE